MMLFAVALFAVGLFLSAFFSGSETGLYRVTRLRLVLDARAGDRVAARLLWLVNRPALFVATTLVGNNLANYITSLAVVTAVDRYSAGQNELAAIVAPVVLSPFLFVYAELLPKNLFFQSPNRLLHRGGRLLWICSILFAPLSAVLWAMSKALEWFSGQSPEMVKTTLARKELARIFEVGHAAGLLNPSQRQLAQGLFVTAGSPVTNFLVPPQQMPKIHTNAPRTAILRVARRSRSAVLVAYDPGVANPAGYVRVIDLRLTANGRLPVRPLLRIDASSTQISALEALHEAGETLAQVVDHHGQTVGVTASWRLREPLFGVSN